MADLITAVVLAMASATVAITMAKTRMFYWYRLRMQIWNPFLGHLAACHYCTGHWAALALVAIYQPHLVVGWFPADLVVSWLAVTMGSALISGVVLYLTPIGGHD